MNDDPLFQTLAQNHRQEDGSLSPAAPIATQDEQPLITNPTTAPSLADINPSPPAAMAAPVAALATATQATQQAGRKIESGTQGDDGSIAVLLRQLLQQSAQQTVLLETLVRTKESTDKEKQVAAWSGKRAGADGPEKSSEESKPADKPKTGFVEGEWVTSKERWDRMEPIERVHEIAKQQGEARKDRIERNKAARRGEGQTFEFSGEETTTNDPIPKFAANLLPRKAPAQHPAEPDEKPKEPANVGGNEAKPLGGNIVLPGKEDKPTAPWDAKPNRVSSIQREQPGDYLLADYDAPRKRSAQGNPEDYLSSDRAPSIERFTRDNPPSVAPPSLSSNTSSLSGGNTDHLLQQMVQLLTQISQSSREVVS